MMCPHCGHLDNRVLETRVQKDGDIRRRRKCNSCQQRFTTLESVLQQLPFLIKKDGRREQFDPIKLKRGIQLACQKRPVSQAQIEAVVSKITNELVDKNEKEIHTSTVGEKVIKELRLLDDVAYVRFASVYKVFTDIQEFILSLEDRTQTPDQENGSENSFS